jgi:hypothetical protein
MPAGATDNIRTHYMRDYGPETAAFDPLWLPAELRPCLRLKNGDHIDRVQISVIFVGFFGRQQAFIGPIGQMVNARLHDRIGPQIGDPRCDVGRPAIGKRLEQTIEMDTGGTHLQLRSNILRSDYSIVSSGHDRWPRLNRSQAPV